MTYAIVNEENIIVNLIEYDGVTEYNPGEGLSVVLAPEGVAIGDSIDA